MRQGRDVSSIPQCHSLRQRGKEQNAQPLRGLLLNYRLQLAPWTQSWREYLYRTEDIGTLHGLIIHDQAAPFIG